MVYLYLFLVFSILAIWFLAFGWLLYIRLMRFPLKRVTIGYPKLFSFNRGAIEYRIGLLPISSNFDFGDGWMKGASAGKNALLQLLNVLIPLVVMLVWPLLTGIGYEELMDALRYHTFQLRIGDFVARYGPLDLADVGALVFGLAPMMFLQPIIPFLQRESLQVAVASVSMLAWLGLFVRLCIQLYGY